MKDTAGCLKRFKQNHPINDIHEDFGCKDVGFSRWQTEQKSSKAQEVERLNFLYNLAKAYLCKAVQQMLARDADAMEGNRAIVYAVQADLVAAVPDLHPLTCRAIWVADLADECMHTMVFIATRGMLCHFVGNAQSSKHSCPLPVLCCISYPPACSQVMIRV
jgi:hypothetical protein